jgi:hypothetical protein
MRSVAIALLLVGCGSGNGSCPAPAVQPKCLPTCVASWYTVITECQPMGACTTQTDSAGTRYCFANDYKVTLTAAGTNSYHVKGALNGITCLSGTYTQNGNVVTDVYDPNNCGSLTVTSTSGSNMLTYICNGQSTTVDTTSAACMADFTAYGNLVNVTAFQNCTMGTCAP